MQQPYAAAMAAGVCHYTRRGKATSFHGVSEEWVAIHCGSNDEHLKNKDAMAAIRRAWPDCPDDATLKAGQRHFLGFARFQDSVPASAKGPTQCAFMQQYLCSKPFCWRADAGSALPRPIPYPKGNLQIWNVYDDAFGNASDAGANFRSLLPSGTAKVVIKTEGEIDNCSNSSSSSGANSVSTVKIKDKKGGGSEIKVEASEDEEATQSESNKRRRRE